MKKVTKTALSVLVSVSLVTGLTPLITYAEMIQNDAGEQAKSQTDTKTTNSSEEKVLTTEEQEGEDNQQPVAENQSGEANQSEANKQSEQKAENTNEAVQAVAEEESEANLSKTSFSANLIEGGSWKAGVYIHADNDSVFPSGETVTLESTSDAKLTSVISAIDAVRDSNQLVQERYSYDVSVLDAQGNNVAMDASAGSAGISLDTLTGKNLSNIRNTKVYCVDSNGVATELLNPSVSLYSSSLYVGAEIAGTGTFVIETSIEKSGTYAIRGESTVNLSDIFSSIGEPKGLISDVSGITVSKSDCLEAVNTGTTEEPNWQITDKTIFEGTEYIDVAFKSYPTLRITMSAYGDKEGALVDDDPLPSQDETSESMKYLMNNVDYDFDRNEFDVRGIFNGNEIQTTYANQGYENSICIDGKEYGGTNQEFGIGTLGKVYELDRVQFKTTAKLIDGGDVVKYTYTVFNNSDSVKTVRIGNGTDVQIGDNDAAAITLSNGGQVISMMDDHTGSCSSKGLEYVLSADTDTPFTGAWIGHWSDRDSHYADCLADQSYSGDDSGLTFHWDITLQPGEKATRTCYFQVKSSLVVENPQLTADAENKNVSFNIPFTDAEKRTVTLHYTLEGASEKTADVVLGEGQTEGVFQFNEDASSWTPNTYRSVTLYAIDNVGYRSKTYTFNVWWPEFNPDKTYHTLSFANTSKYYASVRDAEGTVVTLPTDSDDEKTFSGWNTAEDGSGAKYEGGAAYAMTEEDVTLYAQWKIPVESLDIIANNPSFTGEPITDAVVVKFGTKTLIEGSDYQTEYTGDTTKPGTVTTRIFGGNLEGETSVSFTIKPAEIENVSVTPKVNEVEANGTDQTVEVNTSGETVDGSAISYMYYLDGADPSTATETLPTVKDAGTYMFHYIASAPNHADSTGTFTVTVKPSIKAASVTNNEYTYSGSPITPQIVLKDGDVILVEGVDYEIVSGKDPQSAIGEYQMVIKGKGIYEGTTRTITWKIVSEQSEPVPAETPEHVKMETKPLQKTGDETPLVPITVLLIGGASAIAYTRLRHEK